MKVKGDGVGEGGGDGGVEGVGKGECYVEGVVKVMLDGEC